MTIHPCFIGIDITKGHLDVFEEEGSRSLRIANTQEALAALMAPRQGRSVCVAFEATGPYDLLLRRALERGGIALCRINPLRARDFARIKQCEGDHCGWLFFDTTKNRLRRWCEMEVCGNRAKVRAFRQRRFEAKAAG